MTGNAATLVRVARKTTAPETPYTALVRAADTLALPDEPSLSGPDAPGGGATKERGRRRRPQVTDPPNLNRGEAA